MIPFQNQRRRLLLSLGALAVAASVAHRFWPRSGFWHPCASGRLPQSADLEKAVRFTWQGLDASQVWDSHVHLLGAGHGKNGTWINPDMDSLAHPIQFVQKKFYLNAACVEDAKNIDMAFVTRLKRLKDGLPDGCRFMLLAFDYCYSADGQRKTEWSPFYTPNAYASKLASSYPGFEWIASIHPYREDALESLDWALKHGTRAIKWLPPVMGMDPASSRCDRFYEVLVKSRIPLLVHVDRELAVSGGRFNYLANPLRLRRPLEHGVRVIVAHCASQGSAVDLDKGENGPKVSNFELFTRLMENPAYRGHVWGDISAITQVNRMGRPLKTLLERSDWHAYLINGSDYPLPGVLPLFSMEALVRDGVLDPEHILPLRRIRQYNPMLFDLALKRRLVWQGKSFSNQVFHSRRAFVS